METIQKLIQETGLFELFFLLFLLLAVPIFFLFDGISNIKSESQSYKKKGILYLTGAIFFLILDVIFSILFGKNLWLHISNSFGPTMKGLFITSVACFALLPVCYIGIIFRESFEKFKIVKYDQSRRISNQVLTKVILASVILLLIIIAGFYFFTIKIAVGLVVAILFALTVGWFDSFIVPQL